MMRIIHIFYNAPKRESELVQEWNFDPQLPRILTRSRRVWSERKVYLEHAAIARSRHRQSRAAGRNCRPATPATATFCSRDPFTRRQGGFRKGRYSVRCHNRPGAGGGGECTSNSRSRTGWKGLSGEATGGRRCSPSRSNHVAVVHRTSSLGGQLRIDVAIDQKLRRTPASPGSGRTAKSTGLSLRDTTAPDASPSRAFSCRGPAILSASGVLCQLAITAVDTARVSVM